MTGTVPDLPLQGVRVLDLGQYVAGPLAATLLGEAGAEVVRVERPGGPSLDDPGNAYLLKDRAATHVIDLKTPDGRSRALDLVAGADVLVENFRPGVMARLGLDDGVCRARNPGLVYCSLPGFSERDERARIAAWEGVVMAAGGGYGEKIADAIATGATGATPPFPALPLASSFAAAMAALSACAALFARERDGGLGQRIETPLSDGLLEASGIMTTTVEKRSPVPGFGLGGGLYRSRDDQVVTICMGVHRHLVELARVSGRTEWLEDGSLGYHLLRTDASAIATVKQRLVELIATRDAADWENLLPPAGIAATRLRTTREWLRDPIAGAAGGGVVEQTGSDGRTVRTLARAVELVPADIPADTPATTGVRGRREAPPLDGVRVVDLSRVVAAPTVARLLADLGADVVKVDSDPAKARMAYDEPLFHVFLNRGKRGIILDLKHEQDRVTFDGLIGAADVVVTNISTGRLPAVGLAPDDLRRSNPGIVFAYVNMYGPEGARAELRGYAELANAATGVSALTAGWTTAPTGAPLINNPPWPYTDSMAGILSAFGVVAALFDRARRGRGWNVETSLTRAALFEQMPFAVDAADVDPGRGRDISRPTYGAYAARDRPVFVAIHPDDVTEAKARLGGDPAGSLADRIAVLSAQACVDRLCFGRSAAQALEPPGTTMAAGSPWAQRGLRLERPSEDYGVVVTQGPVSRLTRTPAVPGPTPRVFGTDEVEGWVA